MTPQRSLKLFSFWLAVVGIAIIVWSSLGGGLFPGVGGVLFGSLVASVGLTSLIITNSKGTK